MSSIKITELRNQISDLRQQLVALQKVAPAENVENYTFETNAGVVTLAELFGDKDALFMIHNMGIGCAYCTLWTDGFNGVAAHLVNRAAVVISSPDSPAVQAEFKQQRGWHFPIVSAANNQFTQDMGYQNKQGIQPGVSVFKRVGEEIQRVSDTPFGPGDDFCAVWHLLDLLPEGANGWQPDFQYC